MSSSKPSIGAQLFTVRENTQTVESIKQTFKKISDIGYKHIQISGFGQVDPKELAKLIADSGLHVAATHMPWKRFLEDIDNLIEEHKLWNCKHLAVGGIPDAYMTEDGVKQFIEELEGVMEKLRPEGMDFSYHNHNKELAHVGGKPWLATLYSIADPDVLKAEIDTYWIQAGGGDPAQWIMDCAGRCPVIHLKDMIVNTEREQRFAPIGEGNLNWSRITKVCEDAGVECMLVEQDRCYDRDPFECLASSFKFLSGLGYE